MKASNENILITGASSGIGLLTALELVRRGHRVYATMRDPTERGAEAADRLRTAADQADGAVIVGELDVTKDDSVDRAVTDAIERLGGLDAVVNNAGVMNIGVTEAFTVDEVQRQFDVNLLGVIRVNRAVLPHMRVQGSGLLVHVSSLVGRVVIPFFGVYTASKFALEALAESMRYELASFGVDSIIVEPGPFRTELFANSPANEADPERVAAYGPLADAPGQLKEGFLKFLDTPEAPGPDLVATAIGDLVEIDGPRPLRTVVGVDYGVRDLNRVIAPIQEDLLAQLGFGEAA